MQIKTNWRKYPYRTYMVHFDESYFSYRKVRRKCKVYRSFFVAAKPRHWDHRGIIAYLHSINVNKGNLVVL